MKHIYLLFLFVTTFTFGQIALSSNDEVISSHSNTYIQNQEQNLIKIYPNPVKGNILYIDVKSEATIEIFNVLGKRVINAEIGNPSYYLDISKLNRGIYLVKVKTDLVSITKKLIRQ